MFLLFIITSAITTIVVESNKCFAIPKVYEELGCVGKELDSNNCPTSFECPDVENYDPQKCYYKGNKYNSGQQLFGGPACMADCRCNGSSSKKEKFTFLCANVECPEHLDYASFEGCNLKYEQGRCCAHINCDAKIPNPLKCYYKGVEYVDGQIFNPSDPPCHECICNKDFDNSTDVIENKNCQRVDCGIEIKYFDQIQKRCAPTYFQSNTCCPIGFRCPSKNDQIMPSNSSDNSLRYKCKYGNLTMHKGQTLNSVDECVKCTCNLPPMVECIRTC